MSIRSLLSTTLDQFENKIKTSSESFENFTTNLAEKAKELNSAYNIKCEELGHTIALFEGNSEIEKRYISLLSDFDMDSSIKGFDNLSLLMNGKHDNARKGAEEQFKKFRNGLLEVQGYKKGLDIKIRKLARELYDENIAQLEIEQIKEHLYKDRKLKK